MTPEELRQQALAQRFADLEAKWTGKEKPCSPPCENCGQAKTGPTPKVIKHG